MEEAWFWNKIYQYVDIQTNGEVDLLRLNDELHHLSSDELTAFHRNLRHCVIRASTQDIWNAAYLIHGNCSEDSFLHFRGWLVAHGHRVYSRALENADSLVDVARESEECEAILYAAQEAHQRRFGRPIEEINNLRPPLRTTWNTESVPHMRAHYPRLFDQFRESHQTGEPFSTFTVIYP